MRIIGFNKNKREKSLSKYEELNKSTKQSIK